VVGGKYKVDGQLRHAEGIAGQRVTRGGIVAAQCSVVLEEPLKALMSGMLRPTPATTVAAKSFYFGNQDGEWTYTDCQPGGFIAKCAVNQSLTTQADFWANTPAQTAVGDSQEAVSGGIADNWSDFDVLVDSVDYACQSFKLSLNTNPFLFSTLDARSTDSKRLPVEVLLGSQEVELVLECAKQIPAASTSVLADDIDTDIDVVIAGDDVTFTLSGLGTPEEVGPYQKDSSLLIWRYTFEGAELQIS